MAPEDKATPKLMLAGPAAVAVMTKGVHRVSPGAVTSAHHVDGTDDGSGEAMRAARPSRSATKRPRGQRPRDEARAPSA